MDAHVGARVEVERAAPLVRGPDLLAVLALFAASAAVHGHLVTHTVVTARDSLGFARYAANLESPGLAALPARADGAPAGFADVVRAAQHPPGYPLTVLAAAQIVRPFDHRPAPEQMLLAAQLAAAAAAFLLVIPTYATGRMLFGPFAGFAAALLFQVLPVPAKVTSDGLAEGLYLLCTASAVAFGVRGLRGGGIGHFLLAGAACGFAYLVRPEGLMAAAAVGGVALLAGLFKAGHRAAALGRGAALAVGVLAIAAPYMALIGGVSNKSTFNEFLNRMIDRNPRSELGTWDRADRAVGGPPFADWYDAEAGGKAAWAAGAVGREVWKSFHYAPAVLAVIGLFAVRRRFAAEPELAVLPVLGALNAVVIGMLGYKIGYVSERHTLLIVLIGCYFAAAGLDEFVRWCGGRRFAGVGLLVALIGSAVPSDMKPLHENRAGHYHAGKYLGGEGVVGPNDAVIDPFCWAEWYAGRTLHAVPADPAAPAARWAVVEKAAGTRENPHSRLPRLEAALNVANDSKNPATLMYWWPEGDAARAKVLVYKQVVK